MSNCSSCLFILTQLIGFEKIDNGEKITLPDDVEIDTLVAFKNFLQDSNESNLNNYNVSSYKVKMVENTDIVDNESYWACNHCTYHNSIDLNSCQMCGLPGNVCVVYHITIKNN